jgi:leucyl/phenylalanyl-tRNA--protein transferase
MTRPRRQTEITPDLLIRAYSIGMFPMAEDREAENLFWVEPEARGVFPLDALKISKSLAKSVRSDRFTVRADGDFEGVMRACAERDKTWINAQILKLYSELHRTGRAHSIEAYEDGVLVGGLYGVSLGAAFFGESMFHRATDASKVALVHLAARLKLGGYRLLDAQFLTPHLASLGAIEISRAVYRQRLEAALVNKADFSVYPAAKPMSGALALSLALGLRGSGGAGAA